MGRWLSPDGSSMHAVLWYKGWKIDIGTPGLGGPNSAAFGVNEFGQTVGQAETSRPNAEDFCGFNAYGFASSTACRPFLWQDGVMTKLPTLGGHNGFANSINNRGVVAGIAETDATDPTPGCPVHQFEPVVWGREAGSTHFLHTLVTRTGSRPRSTTRVRLSARQALAAPSTRIPVSISWKTTPCSGRTALRQTSATSAGKADSRETTPVHLITKARWLVIQTCPTEGSFHGFLWTRKTGMKDLGTLSGDFASLALGINDGGVVVGASIGPAFSTFRSGSSRGEGHGDRPQHPGRCQPEKLVSGAGRVDQFPRRDHRFGRGWGCLASRLSGDPKTKIAPLAQ